MNFHLIPFQNFKIIFSNSSQPNSNAVYLLIHFSFHFFKRTLYQNAATLNTSLFLPQLPPPYLFFISILMRLRVLKKFDLPFSPYSPHKTSPAEFGWAKPNQTYNLFSFISYKISKIV